jgi:hypothetical protein
MVLLGAIGFGFELVLVPLEVVIQYALISIAIVYYGRKESKPSHFGILCVLLFHLSFYHYQTMMADFFNVNYSYISTGMMLVLKWVILYQDALNFTNVECFSYLFFFPTIFIGPCLEIRDYVRLVRDPVPLNSDSTKRILYHSLYYLLQSLVYAGIYIGGQNYFGLHKFEDVLEIKNPLIRLCYFYSMLVVYRCKFYYLWSVNIGPIFALESDTSFIKTNFINVDPLAVEIASSFNEVTKVWNKATHRWLKNKIYKPLVLDFKYTRQRANMMTFIVSSVWHGLYPGCYLTLLSGFLLSQTSSGMLILIILIQL